MDVQHIVIPPIILKWSDWYNWDTFVTDVRTDSAGIRVPNQKGVYEVKLVDTDERLTIGKASNLRMRIKQGLVKGKVPHSSGRDIREKEDTTQIVIRWAVTNRPSAVEEELHRKYVEKFGKLPKYTDRT